MNVVSVPSTILRCYKYHLCYSTMSTIADLKKGVKSKNDFIYRIAVENDRDEVLNLLQKHYYPDEPLNIGNSRKFNGIHYSDYDLSCIQYGSSMVALDPAENNKIVGIYLTKPSYPKEWESLYEEAKVYRNICKKWSEILELFAVLRKSANIHERYKIDSAIHLHSFCVAGDYRGKFVGRGFYEPIINLSNSLGCKTFTTDATSFYSMRILEDLKIQCIFSLAYSDHKDDKGRQIFNPPSPHTHVRTYLFQV